MEEEKIVKIEVTLGRIFFPKYKNCIESGEYGIFIANVLKVLSDSYLYSDTCIKLKGICCKIEYGTTYKVYCKLVDSHEKYGDTYEIIFINKCIDISSKDKQKEYLKNVLREDLVEKLFDEYDDVLKLFEEQDIKSLIKIKGIGVQVAKKLIDDYNDSKDYSSIYMELGKLGMTSKLIKKLVDYYASPDVVIEKIRNDPYDLVNVDGIGFKRADEIACQVGYSKYDHRRIKAFLIHHMTNQGELGKSFLNYDELMKELYDVLGFVPEEVISKAAQDMMKCKDVIVLDEGNKITLSKYYNLEKNILNELLRLQMGIDDDQENETNETYLPRSFENINVEKVIKDVEIEQGFDFTDEQKNAIILSSKNNVTLITGGAGVGKSSTAKGICTLYKGGYIVACALSGKASVRITEATGFPASTIHRTLNYNVSEGFYYNTNNKIPADVILLDEATMVNGTLFLSLLQAIPTGAKVIIMGDVQQLTPIGNCQVFADILNSNVLPIARLTKPHRQAMRSGIIPVSMKIADQTQIFDHSFTGRVVLGELKDMELDIVQPTDNLETMIVDKYQEQLKIYQNIMEVQICVPMRKRGALSCFNLNTKLQSAINPKLKQGKQIEVIVEKKGDEYKKYFIREKDKVLNTKNNYKCLNTEGVITPVYNGNMGIVKEIYDDGSCMIDFIGIGTVLFGKSDAKNLELGYACTIHKMQGSGFKSVIVGIDSSSYVMNNCELLYTAVTRAIEYLSLNGVNIAIRKAIQTKEINSKQTFLKDMLLENKDVFCVYNENKVA